MTDTSAVVHIGENSPEEVAFKLMRHVSVIENKSLYAGEPNSVNRKWLLDTYAECLRAVQGNRPID